MTNVEAVDCIAAYSGRRSLFRAAPCLLSVLLVIGCGSESGLERIAVSGNVTHNGKSAGQGSISFLPAEGHTGPAANGVISGGSYSFSAENGHYRETSGLTRL